MHRGFSWSPGSWSCSPQNKPLLEEKREHEHASGTVSVAKGHSCRARPGKPAAGGKRAGSAPPSPPTHCLHAHPPISHPPTKDLPPSSACRGCTHTWGGQPDLSSWVRIADQSRPGAGFQGQQQPRDHQPSPGQPKKPEEEDQQGAWPDTGIVAAQLELQVRINSGHHLYQTEFQSQSHTELLPHPHGPVELAPCVVQPVGLLPVSFPIKNLILCADAHTKEISMGTQYSCEDPALPHCLGSARQRPLRNRSSKKRPDMRIPLHPLMSHGSFFCPFPAASPGGTWHLSPAAVWNGARAGVSRDVNLAPSARLDAWPRATIQKENCSGCLGLKPEPGVPVSPRIGAICCYVTVRSRRCSRLRV